MYVGCEAGCVGELSIDINRGPASQPIPFTSAFRQQTIRYCNNSSKLNEHAATDLQDVLPANGHLATKGYQKLCLGRLPVISVAGSFGKPEPPDRGGARHCRNCRAVLPRTNGTQSTSYVGASLVFALC